MKFFDVLSPDKKEIISLVGAGGKTSIMFALGKEAEQKGIKTILTTTTKIFCPVNSSATLIVSDDPDDLFYDVNHAFTENCVVIAGKSVVSDRNLLSPAKLEGFDRELFNVLADTNADLIIVEADGAAGKLFKAPAEHEPVIPDRSTIVMPIVGIDCLNRPLSSDYVHRPDIVAQIAGVIIGERITPEVIASVFTSAAGYRKGLPPNARWFPFINKVDTFAELAKAREIAYLIRRTIPSSVLIGAALDEDPVKEVIA